MATDNSTPTDDFKTLPAPHGAVAVRTEWRNGHDVMVEYIGPTLEALHAAGCIDERTMTYFIANPRRRIFNDTRKGEFPCECRRRKGFNVLITRCFFDVGLARSLPGVPAYKPKPEDVRAWCELVAACAVQQMNAHGMGFVKRTRTVGRFQRAISWATVDGILVIPDWVGIKAHVIVNRAS